MMSPDFRFLVDRWFLRGSRAALAILCLLAVGPVRAQTGPTPEVLALTPDGRDFLIPVQQSRELTFRAPTEWSGSGCILLEFDGRIGFERGMDGYAPALEIFLDGAPLREKRLVNLPQEFRRVNGCSSAPGKWSFKVRGLSGKAYPGGFEQYVLQYAPSFAAIESDENDARPVGFSGHRFAFDLTQDLRPSPNGEHRLVFRNALAERVEKVMNSKTPVVLAHVALRCVAERPARPPAFWVEEIERVNRSHLVVVPRTEWREPYAADVAPDGRLCVTIHGVIYEVSSRYSFPHGGFNYIGKPNAEPQEAGWKVAVSRPNDGFLVLAEGDHYSIRREVSSLPTALRVRDTLVNKGRRDLGMIVVHECAAPAERDVSRWVAGRQTVRGKVEETETPLSFVAARDTGLGLVPGDDVFRIHCANFATDSTVGIEDAQFALAAGESYTFEWLIFPVASSSHFRFLNNLREHFGLNGITANGVYVSIGKPADPEYLASRAEWINHRPEVVHVKIPNRFGGKSYWGHALRHSRELHEANKAAIARLRAILRPNVQILASFMAPYFSNGESDVELREYPDSLVVNRNGRPIRPDDAHDCYIVLPTQDNKFGRLVTETVDLMLDNWKADGVYFDYMEGARTYYTYNGWDGHSADVDPVAKTMIARKGSYNLLSQEFLIGLVRHIREKGGIVVGNRNPRTWTTAQALKRDVPVRYAESGTASHLVRGLLAPCPMGLLRTSPDLHSQVLRSLYEGMLCIPYDSRYECPDNLMTTMWPFTVREIGRGYVIGRDKIVTMVNGLFGWGDGDPITVYLFDGEGKLTENRFPIVQKDSKTYVHVQMPFGHVAILVRKR